MVRMRSGSAGALQEAVETSLALRGQGMQTAKDCGSRLTSLQFVDMWGASHSTQEGDESVSNLEAAVIGLVSIENAPFKVIII